MTRARTVIALHGLLAAAGAAVLVLGAEAAASGLSFDPPSAAALARACASFALPDVSLAAAAALSLGSLAAAAVILGARSAARQVWASRRILTGLPAVGQGPQGAVLFEFSRPHAFCAGLLRARVYLSTGAIAALSADELDAVLAHEAHHARMRDPLRVLAVRVVADALFFLPAARGLAERYAALAELAADAAAVRAQGAQPLASAMLAFERADPAVVGIAAERVDHLLGERPAWQLPLALIAWSLTALTLLGAVVWRLDAAQHHATLNVPLAAAQACMVLMAVLPLIMGACAILGARRAIRTRAS